MRCHRNDERDFHSEYFTLLLHQAVLKGRKGLRILSRPTGSPDQSCLRAVSKQQKMGTDEGRQPPHKAFSYVMLAWKHTSKGHTISVFYSEVYSFSLNKTHNRLRYLFREPRAFPWRHQISVPVADWVCLIISLFWDVKPRGSCKNRSFGGTYRLHHQGETNKQGRNNWHHIAEDGTPHSHCRENLKSYFSFARLRPSNIRRRVIW
jgi:hypothetical protein